MKKLTIIIEDISEGKGKAFMAKIPELNDSIAMGDNLKELFDGIRLTIDTAKKTALASIRKRVKKFNYTPIAPATL